MSITETIRFLQTTTATTTAASNSRPLVNHQPNSTKAMSSAATKDKQGTWIDRFCSMDGNEYLCKVDRDFIIDKFNLCGLEELVPFYRQSCEIIVDKIDKETLEQLLASDSDDDDYQSQDVYNKKIQILSSAEVLYGLIHARYILTDSGLSKMREKYLAGQFGKCTRYYCEQASMLPIGLSDDPNQQPVRLYCPRCMDIFVPHLSISSKYISIDGAYFGTNFPHMFFMVFPEARPPKPIAHFVPSLYGFQIHPSAYEHQQKMSTAKTKNCPMAMGRTGADGVTKVTSSCANNGDMATMHNTTTTTTTTPTTINNSTTSVRLLNSQSSVSKQQETGEQKVAC